MRLFERAYLSELSKGMEIQVLPKKPRGRLLSLGCNVERETARGRQGRH